MGCNCGKKNVIKKVLDVVKTKATENLASNEVFHERMNTCQKCEFYSGSNLAPRCLQCGCFLDAAARLANHKCPLDKWEV